MTRARLQLIAVLVTLALISGALFLRPSSAWLDQSSESFLPKNLASKLSIYRNYPVFWWNLLVIEGKPGVDPDAAAIASFCRTLLSERTSEISLLPCSADLAQYKNLLADWVRDLPLRSPSPTQDEVKEAVGSSIAKLSLPLGPDLLSLMRADPLGSFRDLQSRATQSAKFSMEPYAGFYFDRKTGRVVIPIQFSYPPNEAAKTGVVVKSAQKLLPGINAIGPHISNYENESQVKNDVVAVSIAETILLILIAIAMIYLGQARLLVFYPFLFLSTAASITLTVWWMGHIHGLVLAFGPAIVGLSMDYAVHAAFAASEKQETWLANAIGVLTTITVVVVGYFSELPVIQQLMIFSGCGLIIGFVVFYLLDRSEPYLFRAEIFMRRPLTNRWLALITIATAFCAIIGFALATPDLKLSDIGYESATTHNLQMWMGADQKIAAPVMTTFKGSEKGEDALKISSDQASWAGTHGVELRTIAQLLPSSDAQTKNIESWKREFCSWGPKLVAKELFSPFWSNFRCSMLEPVETATYLHDFYSQKDESWITMWFPKEGQLKSIQDAFPGTQSLVEIANMFPKSLAHEIFWMAPVVFALSLILLVIYYRRASLVGLAFLPFLTGLGFYFIAYALFDWKISFVTLIGFIMIFGFSLDYGIFAANVDDATTDHGAEVRSALTLTTTMTLAGFIPLLFAKHPAMKHLGEALVTGTIGTYLGAVSAVPFLFKHLKERLKT